MKDEKLIYTGITVIALIALAFIFGGNRLLAFSQDNYELSVPKYIVGFVKGTGSVNIEQVTFTCASNGQYTDASGVTQTWRGYCLIYNEQDGQSGCNYGGGVIGNPGGPIADGEIYQSGTPTSYGCSAIKVEIWRPKDLDNDGISNTLDQCISQYGVISNNGCPAPTTCSNGAINPPMCNQFDTTTTIIPYLIILAMIGGIGFAVYWFEIRGWKK